MLENESGNVSAIKVLSIKAATAGGDPFSLGFVALEIEDSCFQVIVVIKEAEGVRLEKRFELRALVRKGENSVAHELCEAGGGVEEILLSVEVEAHFALGEEVVVIAAPNVGLAKVARGTKGEFTVEFFFEEFYGLGAFRVLVAVAAEEQIVGQVIVDRVVEGLDRGIGGVGDVVDAGALAAELVDAGAGGGDEDGVHAGGAAVDRVDVVGDKKRVDVAVSNSQIRDEFADFVECLVGDEVAVAEENEAGLKIRGGLDQAPVHFADAEVT